MIYRGPGFLAVVWFGSSPQPLTPLPSPSRLSFSVFLYIAGRAYWQERGLGRNQIMRRQEKPGPL